MADTSELQREYISKKRREARQEKFKGLLGDRRLGLVGIVLVGLAGIVLFGLYGKSPAKPSRRSGAAAGTADAEKLIAKGKLIVYFVDGAKVTDMKDHGKEWSDRLRKERQIFISRRKVEAMPPGDWQAYYRAFNSAVIEAAQLKYGAEVFKP